MAERTPQARTGAAALALRLAGAGYDEVRHIDAQVEVGPGFGMELLKMTNFVWKGEAGFNFQQQYFSDGNEHRAYSIRIAEIFAWRVWDKLTADLKVEFFPNLAEVGEYRFRLESNLRYPVSNRLSLNLDLIDIYDTQPAKDISPNDLQIRSTIGDTFQKDVLGSARFRRVDSSVGRAAGF